MLDCDNGSYDAWYWPHPPVYMPKHCNLKDVAEIKKCVNIPVICAGRFDEPDVADQAIAEGKIDMMGMGRPLLADPDMANKFKEGHEDDIRPCISCHFGCLARIFQIDYEKKATKDICCALNPRCANEDRYNIEKAPVKKKVAVVGGGIAGMEAARVSALRGHDVDLFEKKDHLGGVFVPAASFSFKENDRKLLKWYNKQIQDTSVNVHLNTEFTKEDTANYDEIFVATGAHERKLSGEGLDDPNVRYAVDYLIHQNIKDQNIVVVGGGLTGCEIAYDLALKGNSVTIVEAMPTILNVEGLAAANYNMLRDIIDYYHINVLKNTTIKGYQDGKAIVEETIMNTPNYNERARQFSLNGVQKVIREIPADTVIISVGYQSDQNLYDEIKSEHVHLLGDAIKPGNLMTAIWGAYKEALEL